MLAKWGFYTKFYQKIKFLRLKIMCLTVSLKKEKKIFLAFLKLLKKGAGSGAGSINQRYRSADPDPHQNVTDPQHSFLAGSAGISIILGRLILISIRVKSQIQIRSRVKIQEL
jgi:hypothetical protein